MSISWIFLLRLGVPGEHHEHQLDPFAQITGVPGEHHEHQLQVRGCRASIMSISWTLLPRLGAAGRAS